MLRCGCCWSGWCRTLTAGLGVNSSWLHGVLRDVPQTLAVLVNLWFYVTPIIYPAKMVPEAWFYILLNPMTAIVEVYRDLVLVGEESTGGMGSCFSCCLYWCFIVA